MSQSPEIIILKKLVEDSIPRKIKTPADFTYLSGVIFERCGETISETTLKRIWGYIEGYDTTRFHTLSVLARFAGYQDWENFCNNYSLNTDEQSEEILQKCIYSKNLKVGDKLILKWKPDRECLIEFLGENDYKILDCKNSKLLRDDIFSCTFFVENQPLYIDNLRRGNTTYAMYVVGKNTGLTSIEKVEER